MEREAFGGRRDARSPARSERFQDGRSQTTMRYGDQSGSSRQGDRYSGRYDANGPQTLPQHVQTDQPPSWPYPRSRSRSRSPVRDRGNQRVNEGGGGFHRRSPRYEQAHHGGRGGGPAQSAIVFDAPPNATLIIKNLPPIVDDEMLMRELANFQPLRTHTIRDRDTGASRGFAFVDFESVEHATRVINTFEYIPLVLADRAVVLGYASNRRPPSLAQESDRSDYPHREHGQYPPHRDEYRVSDRSNRPPRLDWLCDQCNATNFSRRTTCFKCYAPKGEYAREVPADFSHARSSLNARQAAAYDSEHYRYHDDRGRGRYDGREGGYSSYSRSPESRKYGSQSSENDAAAPQSNVLAVRQLPFDVEEGQLQVAFASCNGVRDIRLVRDRATNESRGFAFVEFVDADAARQALETSQNLAIGEGYARLSYAYDAFHPKGHRSSSGDDGHAAYETDYRSRRDDREHSNSIAATALEQAQWALANGYRRSGAPASEDADDLQQTDIVDDVNALLNSAAEAARPRIEEPKKQWPQPFETGGGSYVYASDVGLYWDQDSMFYYSPATKLYYSVFLGKYFRCDVSGTTSDGNPFQEVTPPVPVDDAPFVQDASVQQPAVQQRPTASQTAVASSVVKPASGGVSLSLKLPAKKKAPVSFGLKSAAVAGSKKLKTAAGATAADSNPTSAAFAAGTAPIVGAMPPAGMMRKSAQDIAKWSQVQRKTKLEEQQQASNGSAGAASAPGRLPFESASVPKPAVDKAAKPAAKGSEPSTTTAAVTAPTSAPSVVDALVNTAVEVPICLLCRRKFNSMEVLRKHETMSKLHLENLVKARQDKEVVAAQYRERERTAAAAHEKREREAASQEAQAKRQRLAEAAASSKPAQEAKAAAAALEQGIGGKMLKMMGWKSGEGLGKRGTGITAPITATSNSAGAGGGNSSNTAGLGARAALPVTLTESTSYKERVQSFTRARYDATGSNEQ